jgi:hypothetical protein
MTSRRTDLQRERCYVATEMARDAFARIKGDDLLNIAYTVLADHPGLSPDQLDQLANRLGRAAHERARNGP